MRDSGKGDFQGVVKTCLSGRKGRKEHAIAQSLVAYIDDRGGVWNFSEDDVLIFPNPSCPNLLLRSNVILLFFVT